MSTASSKRPRCEDDNSSDSNVVLKDAVSILPNEDGCCSWYAPLVAWVTVRGGHVHPDLKLDADRNLRAAAIIPAGTLLMRIPAITAPMDEDVGSIEEDPAAHALAWYLASQPPALEPYLNSLPNDPIDLPRLWSPTEQRQLLTGSPVLADLRRLAAPLPRQYQQIAAGTRVAPIPSWDDYSWAHAVVTSRAFSAGENRLSLVPVLDLCNHGRTGAKNVAYTFCADVVQVTAARDIAPHDALCITYGAKPNSVLLVNYGFCLSSANHNIEPDGSSNDVLAWSTSAALLRTGPPAYTYGGFTTALQSFFDDTATTEGAAWVARDPETNDESNDYLSWDECAADENDMEDDDDENDSADESYHDLLYNNQDVEPSNPGKTDDTKPKEVAALQKFREHLWQLVDAYTLPKQQPEHFWSLLLKEEQKESRAVHAARLIASELRILQFYIWATERLERRLEAATPISTAPPPIVPLAAEDVQCMDRHIEELIAVYLQLRHPEEVL